MPKGYWLFLSILIGGWLVLGTLAILLSKTKPKGFTTALLLGPMYWVLKRQKWKFSTHEIALFALLFLLMAIAPLVSYWLE